jgi:SAM-dependent methyltransferase
VSDHVQRNREAWDSFAERYAGPGRAQWEANQPTWGIYSAPEADVGMLPPSVDGLDVIELGCGTAYFGAWLKRHGARRVVGIDVTPAQLDSARALNREFSLGLELLEANAEAVPLAESQFDLAVSEYGASIWCDPELWISEAARLLRPGGELVFLRNSTLATLCMPETGKVSETLQRSQRGLNRVEWQDDDPGVEFHPATGDLLRILLRHGFTILDLVELFAPADAEDHPRYDYVPAEWARCWPSEEIWRLQKAVTTGVPAAGS